MANVFNYIKPKARLDKNGFDLSHRSIFSCKAGAVYPILTYDMVPNDYVEINVNDLLRTATLETAAFARMKQNFEFYFIPYVQLWHNFNEMIAQRKDPITTVHKGSDFNPVMPLKRIVTMAIINAMSQYGVPEMDDDYVSFKMYFKNDIHNYNWGLNTLRLLDLLGYGNYLPVLDHCLVVADGSHMAYEDVALAVGLAIQNGETFSLENGDGEIYVNLWPFLAYQKVWSDFYRNPWRDTDINEYAFNVDDVPCTDLASSDVIDYRTTNATIGEGGTVDDIDNVGLFGEIFAQRYKTWKKDLFSASLPNAQFGDVATVQITNIAVDGGNADENENGDDNQVLFDPADWRVTVPIPQNYVVRKNGGNPNSDPAAGVSIANNIYVTKDQWDSNGNIVGTFNGSDDSVRINSWLFTPARSSVGTIEASNRNSINERRRALNNLIISTAEDVAAFNVYDLKRAEMLQKWSEITMRSGYRTRSLFEGHFGVSPRYDMDNHPAFLGSFDSIININEVTATAATDGVKLGEIAAKGVSVQDGRIRYTSNDFGVLMCMYYIQPEVEYNSFGMDKHRMKMQPFDYFTPEFEDLGFEPVIGAQLNMIAGQTVSSEADLVNQVIGYSPRYAEYKTSYDRVHGLFSETVELNGNLIPESTLSQFSHWVAAHGDAQYSLFENLRDFYIDPNVLDNIFAIASDSKQSSDQFIINCYFDIKAVRPMSVLGLPNW